MSISQTIKVIMDTPTNIVNGYLGDLSDEDLLVRPVDGANHIAWQLGHLIMAENHMMNQVCPDCMPPLPEGFAERYAKETATENDPAAFHSKAEYVKQSARRGVGHAGWTAGHYDPRARIARMFLPPGRAAFGR